MTKRRFARRLTCAALMAAIVVPTARAQQTGAVARPARLINAGDVLSGELEAMRVRDGKTGKRIATYQITSEPRRLPPPSGLCNLETGPETFELVTTSPAQATQLQSLVGKEVSIKVGEVSCAQAAGEMSDAIVSKWSVVNGH
ncbi:MAG: hypothetical protein JOY90_37855 [Bradyrhizobium sp.]|uniref:hypothetical protein n=1 Tax=Bradyrhizobium sp. TaxID=376 RepID=UPI001DF459E3|nr:hypothetical protein [Bradyrhizobium sp.]MBV9566174.1 hypothetical protein [Bradyrhizobium sp.]